MFLGSKFTLAISVAWWQWALIPVLIAVIVFYVMYKKNQ